MKKSKINRFAVIGSLRSLRVSLQLAVLLFLLCGQAWGVVDTLLPVADGEKVEWDHTGCDPGERYDCVDDPPGSPDENTYAYTFVNDEEEAFQFETTSLSDIDSLVCRFNAKKIGAGTAKLYTGFEWEDLELVWHWETRDSITLTTDWADYSVQEDEIESGYPWTAAYINARRFGVKSLYLDTVAWWNEDWDYRIKLSCGNHDEYSTDDFLGITGVDVTGAKFMDNGDDIRMVYQPSGLATDLGRYLIGANTNDASIYWQVQAVIPENEDIGDPPGSDYVYFLYYGNDAAGPPGAYANTASIDAPWSVDASTQSLWHLEEASGTIYDETVNDYDMTGVGVTYEGTGKFGKCLDFDGTDDYTWVLGEDEVFPNNGAITISFWVYCDRDSQVILGYNESHPHSGTWDRGFCIDPGGYIRWKVYKEAPDAGTYVCTSTTSLSLNTWHHVAGVIDEADGTKLYINGDLEATNATATNGYNGYDTPEFLLGVEDDGGWGLPVDFGRFYFDGLIDEVRVCNTTRTNFYHIDNEATLALGSEGTTAGAPPYLTQIFLMVYGAEPPEAEIRLLPIRK